MRFLFKLILAGVAIAALMPFVAPGTSLGTLTRAALDDAAGFCERQPEACNTGAQIARDAHDAVAATIASLTGAEPAAAAATGLTAADRAIVPDQTIPPAGAASRAAFAGHNGTIHY